jgi:glycosyltransferase involved in cell wall biosynthesis
MGSMRIGLVAIGRNEGERLRRCLESSRRQVERLVYVDSGSTDGSAQLARSLGAEVVDLDMSIPFTAARARNEGRARLQALVPDLDCVQFVDGDCELVDGWIARAVAHLTAHPQAAVVCGRRRERDPESSVYNHLCDLEWDTPIGLAKACGGDALMRVTALDQVGGYNPDIIAGEEPDLCFRLRERGWEIWRIDGDMTLHDAAMTRFGQWW